MAMALAMAMAMALALAMAMAMAMAVALAMVMAMAMAVAMALAVAKMPKILHWVVRCWDTFFKNLKRREKMKPETIKIDEVEYVRKDSIGQEAKRRDGMPYCIVRTQSAGVFAGYVESRKGQEMVMRDVRWIWYWDGAATLSQLATDGTTAPQNCKFPVEVDTRELLQVIDIIPCTEKARLSIKGVPVWKR